MRDFSNRNLVEGTAAIRRYPLATGPYRRSKELGNVVLFPGAFQRTYPTYGPAEHTNKRTNADWFEFKGPDARTRVRERAERAAARQKESERGFEAYAHYFSDVVESMAETIRNGSFLGTPGPDQSKAESAIAGTAISAVCLFCALL